jgi:glycosyltransferase involved in cell wall biosynthesis
VTSFDMHIELPSCIRFIAETNPFPRKFTDGTFESDILLVIWWESVGSYLYPNLSWNFSSHEVLEISKFINKSKSKRIFVDKLIYVYLSCGSKESSFFKKRSLDLTIQKIDPSYSNFPRGIVACASNVGLIEINQPLNLEMEVEVLNWAFLYFPEITKWGFDSCLLVSLLEIMNNTIRKLMIEYFQDENLTHINALISFINMNVYSDIKQRLIEIDTALAKRNKSTIYIPLMLMLLISAREDFSLLTTLTSEESKIEVLNWWSSYGSVEYQNVKISPIDLRNGLNGIRYRIYVEYPELIKKYNTLMSVLNDQIVSEKSNIKKNADNKFVNVIGYPSSHTGLGEDVDLTFKSIRDITTSVRLLKAPIVGPRSHVEYEVYEPAAHPALVNIFCLPPTDIVRLSVECGDKWWDGKALNIAQSPWEFDEWPDRFHNLFLGIDEIYTQSKFGKKAFEGLGMKLQKFPMIVELPAIEGNIKNPDIVSIFRFLVIFDSKSWQERKNPIISILAFRQAKHRYTVRLVIKTHGLDEGSDNYRRLIEAVADDPRISLINKDLSRAELVCLLRDSNCLLALHRSEGFGRAIAEAMLLEVSVITSNYSGNLDFCTEETSYLVGGNLIDVGLSEYILSKGLHWFDPDLSEAIIMIEKVQHDCVDRTNKIKNARKFILNHYTMDKAKAFYANELLYAKKALKF